MADPQVIALKKEVNDLRQAINTIKRSRNIEIVKLDPRDNVLKGKFASTTKNVFVECDAEDAAFLVVAPDANDTTDQIIRFRKSDTSSNIVTIAPLAGQTINLETSQVLSREGDNMPIGAMGGNWVIL